MKKIKMNYQNEENEISFITIEIDLKMHLCS